MNRFDGVQGLTIKQPNWYLCAATGKNGTLVCVESCDYITSLEKLEKNSTNIYKILQQV